MRKTILTGAFAFLACAALVTAQAQTPASQAPSAPPAAAPAAPQNPDSPAPAPRAQQPPASSASAANSITVEGCIQRSAMAPSATPGATGTAGTAGSAAAGFTLANAMKASGSTSSAAIASTYRLDADAAKLTPHVGHKVEITGTLDTSAPPAPTATAGATPGGATASASAAAPRLKVDNVKMLAASCTP